MSKSELAAQQSAKNKRLGLIMTSVALVFFVGIMLKTIFFGM